MAKIYSAQKTYRGGTHFKQISCTTQRPVQHRWHDVKWKVS